MSSRRTLRIALDDESVSAEAIDGTRSTDVSDEMISQAAAFAAIPVSPGTLSHGGPQSAGPRNLLSAQAVDAMSEHGRKSLPDNDARSAVVSVSDFERGHIATADTADTREREATDTLIDVDFESLHDNDGQSVSRESEPPEFNALELESELLDEVSRIAPSEKRPPAQPPRFREARAPERTVEPPRPPPEAKHGRAWWEEFFDDDYLRTVPVPKEQDIERYCDFLLARTQVAPGSSILDVGCGLGLHTLELSRRGHRCVGLDFSLPMLARASDDAQDQGVSANLVHGDMRAMSFDKEFDVVCSIGASFGYFDEETNEAVLQKMVAAIKPGGVLYLDVDNRDFVVRSQPNLVWFEGDGCVVMEETSLQHERARLLVKRTVILDDGKQREANYSLRLYAAHEVMTMMTRAGLQTIEISGRLAHPAVFFGPDSPRLMVVARKPK